MVHMVKEESLVANVLPWLWKTLCTPLPSPFLCPVPDELIPTTLPGPYHCYPWVLEEARFFPSRTPPLSCASLLLLQIMAHIFLQIFTFIFIWSPPACFPHGVLSILCVRAHHQRVSLCHQSTLRSAFLPHRKTHTGTHNFILHLTTHRGWPQEACICGKFGLQDRFLQKCCICP